MTETTINWLNCGPCIYCGKDHLSQVCHLVNDETEVTQAPSQTTEAQAKDAYQTWILVTEDDPKPWDKLLPGQRAIWIKTIEDMQNV